MLIYIARPLCSFKRVPTAARAQADGRGRPVGAVLRKGQRERT